MSITFDLTLEQVAGMDTVPLVAVKPFYAYENNVKGRQIGHKYSILLPKNRYATLDVAIEEDGDPIISQEELDKINESMRMKLVRFEEFRAKPYSASYGMNLSAKAKKIMLVEPPPKAKEG